MKNLFQKILNAIIFIEFIERKTKTFLLNSLRHVVFKFINLPIILHYKMIGKIKFAQEVSEILNSLNTLNFLVGGMAYDAKVGRLTRFHKDVDIVIKYDEAIMNTIISSFNQTGFKVKKRHQWYQVIKNNYTADIFVWKLTANNYFEKKHGDTIIRIPKSFFTFEIAKLCGEKFRVASNEYIISIAPFVNNIRSKEYIHRLQSKLPLEFNKRTEEVTLPITLYELK